MAIPYKLYKRKEVKNFILNCEKNGTELTGRDHPGKWYGCSFDDALIRMESGCKECAKGVKSAIIRVMRKESQWGEVYRIPNDTSGTIVDPGALSIGAPECFVIPTVDPQHILGDLGLDIVLNAAVSSGVTKEVIRARGVLTSSIAIIAERLGIATKIVITYTGKGWNGETGSDHAIILKDYGEPLDIPLLAFWLISDGSLRRVGFALYDCLDPDAKHNCYWSPSNSSYKSNRAKQIVIDHGYIRKEMTNPELAVKEAVNILRRYGVIA